MSLKPHWKWNINWINFPETHRKVKGVYLIENFYIGASIHIRKRILQHLSYTERKFYAQVNQNLYEAIEKAYNEKGYITVYRLHEDPAKEGYFINTYFESIVNKSSIITYETHHKKYLK